MGGTPPCTLDPPLRGDCPPCPSRGDNEEQEFHLLGDTLPDTPTEMPGLGTDDQMGTANPLEGVPCPGTSQPPQGSGSHPP